MTSRNAVAIIFSFFGDRDEVSDFMQRCSHLTRVYFINANKLSGFLDTIVLTLLKKLGVEEEIRKMNKFQ